MSKPKKVIIEIRGCIPECVQQPDGVEVVVHDYDLEGYDFLNPDGSYSKEVKKDRFGDHYWEKTI